MRLATRAESARIDRLAQAQGLSAEILMEAAGSGTAREIEQSFVPELRERRGVAIICGPGNNGADGLVVARHLAAAGVVGVRVFLVAPEARRGDLLRLQLARLAAFNIEVTDILKEPERALQFSEFGILIDALFGIGMRGAIEEPYSRVVVGLNQSKRPIVSLDSPSGLDVDRGFASGDGMVVRASMTVTFGIAKPGFFVGDGPGLVGRLRVLPIGLPRNLLASEANSRFAFTETMALRSLPKWTNHAHKAKHGHSLILAGSEGMFGAAVLAASAAFRIGSGYVTLASASDAAAVVAKLPEVLTASVDDEEMWRKRKWTAAGIGPGLGTGEKAKQVLEKLRTFPDARVVVDADAITVAAQAKFFPLPAQWILTPHSGELARVLGISAGEIDRDRLRFAGAAAEKTGCHVLLKGFRTIIAEPGGRCAVILAGNSALSKAGTGDVLTGMITGLLAQGVRPNLAAATAAYVHGRMADEWIRAGYSRRSLQASDLREILPGLIARLARNPSLG